MIDLFAGTGAFSLVFQALTNIKCLFANDMVSESKTIYDLNHDTQLTQKDLNDLRLEEIPPHSILCGGWPCQPFSIAGEQKGFNDPRANVFWKIIEILNFYKPPIIILENVKNLQKHDKGNTFRIVCEHLEKAGYYIKFKVLNTATITSLPQNRERIYIVGFRNKKLAEAFEFDFPKVPTKSISEFLEPDIPDHYYYTSKYKVFPVIKEDVTKDVEEHNVLYQYRRYYVRENKSNVCPTLTANMGSGGHNVPLLKDKKGIRKLTPRECFNLQGFPASYQLPSTLADSKLYKLAGNAVSIPVVQLIVQKLLDTNIISELNLT